MQAFKETNACIYEELSVILRCNKTDNNNNKTN